MKQAAAQCSPSKVREDRTIYRALAILERRWGEPGEAMSDPRTVASFLRLKLGTPDHELFCCVFLDSQHRLKAFEVLSSGTIDAASVYPREVVKRALHHGAAAIIFAHNHPSGHPEPSKADRALTERLQQALDLVGVRVLDHFVIGRGEPVSFAARRWL
jgi:DNA repair protein RadC